ncbi:proline-, glutamic acid- and leucine-rich protein 1-like [Pieris napi]|uniref:proline-, glutamic acid- and leucine-rich protein 1-like n=1 Tax=Pieris napi TaxID=78633 RepID=UPI001FBBDCCD|nr:proline-, glutamic acid- and leucine-rich protein 1-like [Pieris napi]
MSLILKKIRDVDPNNSEAVKECLTGFFQNLMKQSEPKRWLKALDDVIRRFPKYCISHRGVIENFIISFLNSNKYNNVIEAAKCAHSLQQVRPSQEKTSTPKSCWRNQMTLLCSVTHNLIDKLFPDSPSMYTNNLENKLQNITNTPLNTALSQLNIAGGKDAERRKRLITRLENIFVFIQAMLVETYPVAKPIQPQLILDIIVHALSIARSIGQPLNNIAQMKTAALRTLDALIACLGPHLIPYSPLVFRLVMQTLRWTSDNATKETKSVRCGAYNTLKRWLSILHVHKMADSRASMEDELTSHIINDITPTKKLVQLTMGPQPTKNLSKKAKRKLATTQLQESTIATHMPGEKNKNIECKESNEVAVAALECAETLFIVCGIFLKPTTHKVFQERLVRECFNLSSYDDNQAMLLLRTLEACRKTTPNTVPPPTQYCLHLYSTNVTSNQPEIATFCSKAILDIRLHLHCSPPSLNFALQVVEEKTEKRKKVSEKNRAVLESLLGKNKLPPNERSDIITIADEPANKKTRLSEETERISLSSENISSVEISDDSDSEVIQEVDVEIHEPNDIEIQEVNATKNNKGISIEGTVHIENELDKIPKTDNSAIYDMATQISECTLSENGTATPTPKTAKDNNLEKNTIYEAPTQLPLNNSIDTLDGDDATSSLEVTYDYPHTGNEKIPVLEKIEDSNLPLSNETDDIQITCGQVLNSQEESKCDSEKSKENLEIVENGVQNVNVEVSVCDANVQKKGALSVEEMMADFVDEVQDET